MKYTDQELNRLLEKLIASTRSPRGRFSAAASYQILEKRLPRPAHRLFSIRIFSAVAAIALFCYIGWSTYCYLKPAALQTVSTLADTRTIKLPDGTEVTLNHFSSLTYPEKFKGKHREVDLKGEAYFEVAPDKNRPFYVETEEVKIRVLGTVFDVNTHYTRGVRTVLVEGAVALEWGDQKEIRMKPGELADFDRTTTEVTLKEVDVTSYISWKEGYFVFEDEPLEEIMHTLSLWYDKEFLFVGKRSRTLHFSGHIKRYERIETILSAITDVTGVEFRMNGQIILIR